MSHISLEFKCKKCDGDELALITQDVIMSQLVIFDKYGLADYTDDCILQAEISHFQCDKCGATIEDKNGKTINCEIEMIEFLKTQQEG